MRQPRQLPQVKILKFEIQKTKRWGDFRSKNKNNRKTAKRQILFTLQMSLSKFGGGEQL